MEPEIKAKWVAALRSGKYRQGAGVLKNGDRFCCLGVLLDCLGARWGTPEVLRNGIVGEPDTVTGSFTKLKDSVLDEIGLDDVNMYRFIRMNDEGVSFAAIADVIEKRE